MQRRLLLVALLRPNSSTKHPQEMHRFIGGQKRSRMGPLTLQSYSYLVRYIPLFVPLESLF